jgi:hypothetical protein
MDNLTVLELNLTDCVIGKDGNLNVIENGIEN